MTLTTREEILDILKMPYDEFERTIKPQAKEVHRKVNNDSVIVTALLGYDNICKNQCLYCGMRAGFPGLKRFRLGIDKIKQIEKNAWELGLKRIFMVSGEDPGFPFPDMLEMVRHARELGFFVSLGAGELSDREYRDLHEAGLDEYVLKFETSDRTLFNHIKPTSDFDNRMRCIRTIRETGLKLASGNIVGFPRQSLEQIADDIMLMKELEISWAPIIPYLPVPGTPLAQEGGRGSLETLMKEISLLRLLLPEVHITAQQPGDDPTKGLADEQGNRNALDAGADTLFVDMIPADLAAHYNVIDNRILSGFDKVQTLVSSAGMVLAD